MKKNNRLKVLIFEGADKVGKTTLIMKINKITNYEYLCVDRFLASAYVFDNITQRRNRHKELSVLEEELFGIKSAQFINVYLTCSSSSILKKRINKLESNPDFICQNLKKTKKEYKKYFSQFSSLPLIEIDTSKLKINECALKIIHEVKML